MSQDNRPSISVALIVPGCDIERAERFDLPAALLRGDMEADGLSLTEKDEAVVPRAQTVRVVGCLVLTTEGLTIGQALSKSWQAMTGRDLTLVNLSDIPQDNWKIEALRELARLNGEKLVAFARHNSELLKMQAGLRGAYEDQSSALRSTRNFLLKAVKSRRWLAQSHGPLSNEAHEPFSLVAGGRLIQRLAASSAGLSDIGIFLPDQDWPETGTLRVRLHLCESQTSAGSWDLPGAELGPGWQRLTLLDALADDDQTLQLELYWDGPAPLVLGAGVHHPDPAFGVDLAGQRQDRILAHRVWKYLPGARAPLPADGYWTVQSGTTPLYVDPEHLSRALPADPDHSRLQYFPKLEALQVHPRAQGFSAARIPRAVFPGISEISATVGGRDERVPAVEYALAVAPRHPLREIGDLVADCARHGYLSDWICLKGDRLGELRLILSDPLTQVCDLFLITRTAPGAQPAFGWATFRDIRLMSGET